MDARLVVSSPNLITEPCPLCGKVVFEIASGSGTVTCGQCGSTNGLGTKLRSAVVLGSDDYEMTVPCGVCSGLTPEYCGIHQYGLGRVPAPVGVYENVSIEIWEGGNSGAPLREPRDTGVSDEHEPGHAIKAKSSAPLPPLAVAGVVHLIDRENVKARGFRHGDHAQFFTHWPVWNYRRLLDSLRESGPVAYLTDIKETT